MATNFSVGFLDDRSIGGWIDRATVRGKWRGKERLLLFKWEILFDIALASRSAFYLSLEEEK